MRPVDPRLLRYAASARAFFAVGGLLALGQTLTTIAFAWLVTQVIVGAVGGEPLAALGTPLAALTGAVLLRFVLGWLAEYDAARGAALVKSELRRSALAAVTTLGPGRLAGRNSTAVAVTVGPGLDALDTYFSRYLPQLIQTVVAMPLVVLAIWSQDWISGLTITLTLPLIPIFMVLIGWATQSMQQRQFDSLTRLSTAFLDVMGGLSTLTVFGRQHRQAERIRSVTEEYRTRTMRVLRVSFLSGFALELAASLSVALVAVSIGVRLIDGSLGLAVGLFVLLLAPEAFLPLRNVGAQFHAAADGVAASTSLFELLDEAADVASPGAARPAPDRPAPDRPAGVPAGRGDVELRGLGVRYGEAVAFAGLDARIRSGAVTAVTGPSGSGKTSLVNALLGFAPVEGRMLVGGRDVTDDPAPRPWLAWAGQRAVLLEGTVLSNVTLGDAVPDEAAARAALDLVGGDELDLETVVDPRGGGLSGGQAQRVASARAVYRARSRDCAVVVFDEPSSALDEATEQRFIRSLEALAEEGRAVVVVTHRAAVREAADAQLRLELPSMGADAVAAEHPHPLTPAVAP